MNVFHKQLAEQCGLDARALAEVSAVESQYAAAYKQAEDMTNAAQLRILAAFQEEQVGDFHLYGSTGYGYGDIGRDKLEEVWARVFEAESALVRSNIVSGTHAIATVLFALLAPGDELISASGMPYDTLQTIIGETGNDPASLKAMGVRHTVVPLTPEGDIDDAAVLAAIGPKTKLVSLQRSRGYLWRPSLTIAQIRRIATLIHERFADIIVFVDNCYGEFVEDEEPLTAGADIIAGSLIKNPGGALAPRGGYIAGRKDLIRRAATRLTAPGIAFEVGSALDFNRPAFQGLFMAPLIVQQALKGAIFASAMLQNRGFAVSPTPAEKRTDIIQAVQFEREAPLLAFAEGIQAASPLEAYVHPEAAFLPGYDDAVIMAGGTFTQGSSIELSIDAPMRAPYIGYMQGGLSYAHVVYAVTLACRRLEEV